MSGQGRQAQATGSRRASESSRGCDGTLRVGESQRNSSGGDRVGLEIHVQAIADCVEDGSEVVHAGVACRREHAMQALARLGGQRCKMLEAYGRIDQVAQDQPCRLGPPVEEQRGRFVQQSLRKRRIALDPFDFSPLGADGLPRRNTHGGSDLRGVRAAAEKRGGTMTLHWENEWFTLRVLLPQKS